MKAERYFTNLRTLAAAEGKEVTDPIYSQQHVENCRLSNLATILGAIYHAEIRMAFPETAMKPFASIRKGWKVAWRNAGANPAAAEASESKTSH